MSIAYTESETIHVPDIHVEPKDSLTYKSLRGFAYVLAAFESDECVGWILSEDIGYPYVKAWEEAQREKDSKASG